MAMKVGHCYTFVADRPCNLSTLRLGTGSPYHMDREWFTWDETKAAANYAKHGVSFETAIEIFADPFAIERLDDREDYGEERFILIGMAEGAILTVVYAECDGRFRLISARRAAKHEQDDYFTQNA
jgi:uncharacterized protein